MLKFISCIKHSAFFDADAVGCFLHQTIFLKIRYKRERNLDEFPSISSGPKRAVN